MALSDDLTDLLARTGTGILSDATSFGAALDDFLAPEAASRGVLNLLVDAVRQGAVDRLQRDIAHGAAPHMAVAAAGDQLARDRAATDVAPSRWAVAVLGVALGVVGRDVLDAQTAPAQSSVPHPAPASPPPAPPQQPPAAWPVVPPPPAAPPAWGPPSRPTPPRRRTGLIVGAVVLALALVGGGTTAAILIAQDDPSARRTDPNTDGPTTDGPTTDGPTTDSTTDVPSVADEFAIAELMEQVALDSFPGAVDPEVTARSWSVAATNLSDGFPRELAIGERDDATAWTVRATIDIRRLDIRAEHEPSDGGSYYDWSCDDFQSGGDVLAKCTEVAASDGRTAIEYWYINRAINSASHNLVLPADRATGKLEVFVGERLSEPPAGLTIEDLEEKLQLSSRAMLEIAEDPRLRLPLPSTLPPLPSYGFCVNSDPRPADCPEDIS